MGGRRRGRSTKLKKLFLTLMERGSKRAVFVKSSPTSRDEVTSLLSKRVELGSVVYTDEFRSYNHVARLRYEYLRVKHKDSVYALGSVHVNGAESRNWHLHASPFFKWGISERLANFYAYAASAFLRLYAEPFLATCHWLMEVIHHLA